MAQIDTRQFRIDDRNGNPAPNARMFVYLSGSTTPITVYADDKLSITLAQPIVADGSGRIRQVFFDDELTARIDVFDERGNLLGSIDPAVSPTTQNVQAVDVSFTPIVGNSATNVQTAIENNTNGIIQLQDDINNYTDSLSYSSPFLPGVTTIRGALDEIGSELFPIDLGTTDLDTITNFGWGVQNDENNALIVNNYPQNTTNRGYLRTVPSPNGEIHQLYFEQGRGGMWQRTFVPASNGGPAWLPWVRPVAPRDFDLPDLPASPPMFGIRAVCRFIPSTNPVTVVSHINASTVDALGSTGGDFIVLFDDDLPDAEFYATVSGVWDNPFPPIVEVLTANRTAGRVQVRCSDSTASTISNGRTPIDFMEVIVFR